MTDADAQVISDRFRTSVVAQRRIEGGVVIRGPRSYIVLSDAEFKRLREFVEPGIQRYGCRSAEATSR